ncbi:MAG TPA: sugar ABC transporter substrate-binding protein [Roseiflexaceae bacterium]|jgi:multiple sugar transport system substrate-binding protein|nr:sugar ABC transporter substrate-binding protein [Roseiflexaceae bacterium]
MSIENDPKRISRRRFLGTAATGLSGLVLAACGSSSGGSQTGGSSNASGSTGGATAAAGAGGGETQITSGLKLDGAQIKWSTWGNPGEIQRFKEFTDEFNKETGANAQLIPIPNDGYQQKILTQLSGGTAPDVFYAGAEYMGQMIASNKIIDLTERLNGPNSQSKPSDFSDGLWGGAKTADGKIYGVTVDCNPMVFWYNKQLLQDAGITTMPADMQKDGKWTWQAFQDMCKQVVAKGKRGFILENWYGPLWGWATTNGGKVWDGDKFVANEDAKTKEGFKFVQDNLQSKLFTYSGSLPKGQGIDAMFLSQQVAFITAGRWLLPVFKKATNLQYDIVPWPTNTGKKIEPAPIPTAYMVQNASAANPDQAFAFLTNFVSKNGQIFRLQGGGNAVPAIKGADQVVSEGNNPPNWQAFLDAREIGYAEWAQQASISGLDNDINTTLDAVWLKGGDIDATFNQIADIVKKKKSA